MGRLKSRVESAKTGSSWNEVEASNLRKDGGTEGLERRDENADSSAWIRKKLTKRKASEETASVNAREKKGGADHLRHNPGRLGQWNKTGGGQREKHPTLGV